MGGRGLGSGGAGEQGSGGWGGAGGGGVGGRGSGVPGRSGGVSVGAGRPPGRGGSAGSCAGGPPGRSGAAAGRGGDPPGRSGGAAGRRGAPPGRSGALRVCAGRSAGRRGRARGRSGTVPSGRYATLCCSRGPRDWDGPDPRPGRRGFYPGRAERPPPLICGGGAPRVVTVMGRRWGAGRGRGVLGEGGRPPLCGGGPGYSAQKTKSRRSLKTVFCCADRRKNPPRVFRGGW